MIQNLIARYHYLHGHLLDNIIHNHRVSDGKIDCHIMMGISNSKMIYTS